MLYYIGSTSVTDIEVLSEEEKLQRKESLR